ncbi:MAG: hypothetical protein WCQ16_04965 [Verrucomicrobiae bacterium]
MNPYEKFTGVRARKEAAAKPPFGAGFCAKIVAETETLEVRCSGVNDPGRDYCVFRAFNAGGNLIGTKRVNGY